MEKSDELRNKLFEKYFENNDGILLSNLMSKLSSVIDTWGKLLSLFKENVDDFDDLSNIKMIKHIYHNGNPYLIIKTNCWEYIIIDIITKRVLSKEEVKLGFKEEFFIDNFSEADTSIDDYSDMYDFPNYNGDVEPVIDLYKKNERVFNSSNKIFHKLTIDDAYAYISINLNCGDIQLGFQTPDQFLYEHLFLDANLMPWGMQDAQSRIGVQKMKEMFERVKDIKIPISCIPEGIYQVITVDEATNNLQKQLVKK